MTADQRFERHLPAILEDLYLGPTPTYRDEVMATAVRTRQRPSWTFPGRWLPMADIASRPAFAPRVPWRTVGVAFILIALLVVAGLVYVGTRQNRLPPPFGVARNGLVTYTAQGDVYVADASGTVTRLTDTPVLEDEPVFAPNGTHLAFRRPVEGAVPLAEDIVVVKPDGSDPVVVTQTPIVGGPKRLEWSPDSNSILATEQDDAAVWLFDVSGKTPMRTILTNGFAYVRPFRPPDGSALLIGRAANDKHSIISFDRATGQETTLAADLPGGGSGAARWSPDGSQVVYDATPADEPDSVRLSVVRADGTGTQKLVTAAAPSIGIDSDPTWSPDGTQIAFTRYQQEIDLRWDVRPIGIYSTADRTVRSVGPLPRDVRNRNPGTNDSAASYGEGFAFDWSPDGRSLIAYPSEASGHAILIDAVDGTWHALDPVMDPKGFPYAQGWQRLAP